MKQMSINYALILALCVLLLGCGAQRPSTKPAANAQATATLSAQKAPSYEDLQRNRVSIIKGAGYQDGRAPQGEDLLKATELLQRFQEYVDSVAGTLVEDWYGWCLYYDLVEPTESIDPPAHYRVAVATNEPEPDRNASPDVYLFIPNHTAEQGRQIEALKYGQQVVFSGTLKGLDIYGLVGIDEATLAPVK